MSVRLLRAATCEGDPGPQPLRYASTNGRQLFHVASGWPELQARDRVVGVYQAMGNEKLQNYEAITDMVEPHHSFDVFKPASMIFEYLVIGPFAHIAVALGCEGPFVSLEGDEIAGALAVTAALHDLQRGRCEMALVGAYQREPARSWLMLLSADPTAPLRWQRRYTYGHDRPPAEDVTALETALGGPVRLLADRDGEADPHGLAAFSEALQAAQVGERVAVWSCTPDGRGVLVGFGGDA